MSTMPPLIHDGRISGQQIQTAREAKGLTRSELAHQLGMTTHALAQWERGGRQVPYGDFLPRLCLRLGFRPEFFRITEQEPFFTESTLDWHAALQRAEYRRWLLHLRAHYRGRRKGLTSGDLQGLCREALPCPQRAGWTTWGHEGGCCGHIHASLTATERCRRGTDRVAVRLRHRGAGEPMP